MTERRNWPDTLQQFQRVVADRGVEKVADAIPAAATTVYRLIKGETRQPSRAVRAGIERLIRDRKD